ncbi:ATP-binding protein [Kosmotoga arenicorallina S304]|uniref:ATP-binding protein n=1 Tax=Kosmotoga arenicorallina S304 TaxID=1453497 RepID=A0A176K2M7_9BACT|nr:ABC transporter ATP-binding protein [Kosmotoga arenicorallina]OAA31530.1 ATP-binding protein [Kosmotoga arenicorallina S304]
MINVENLFYSYTNDERYAVEGISFQINEGEIFGFLGPNGAGKSTTQKILTGLLPVQKGKVVVSGEDIRKVSGSFYNMIGVSFEQPNVYMKLTGYENLKFFASMFDVPTEDPYELLRLVGLEEAAHDKTKTYSKGMLQRLVFARSLINRPKIWFLDEPVSGLDPATASQIKELIKHKKEEGVTIFLTTHNMHVAEELCDRVAFINAGKIVLIDTPRNLKLRYGKKLVEVEYRSDGKIERELLSMTEADDIERINKLISSGKMETIHSMEASLEDIFIKVTGRGLV